MPGSAAAELYFIAGMMILILIGSFLAVYIFMRQYKKEKRDAPKPPRKPAVRPAAEEEKAGS